MGKSKGKGTGKNRTPVWMIYMQGLGLSLGLYLLAIFFLAWLMTNGTLGERSAFPAIAISCMLSALIGSLRCAGRMGKLPGGLLCGAGFALTIVIIGLFFWDGFALRGFLLPLLILVSSLISGMLSGTLRKKRKRRRL